MAEDRYVGDGSYWDVHDDFHLPDVVFKVDTIWPLIEGLEFDSAGENAQGISFCDVGCGAGGELSLIADRLGAIHQVSRACGYDISSRAIETARSNVPRLEFNIGSSADVPPGWDLIISCDVFEHVDDDLGFLRALNGKAKYYVFHIPLDICAEHVVRQQYIAPKFRETGHIHQYCKGTALETLRASGFNVLQWRYGDKWPHQKRRGRISLKTQILRSWERVLYRVWPDLKVAMVGGASIAVLASDELNVQHEVQ